MEADAEWRLPFEDVGKKWRLLDAERNFAGEDASIAGEGKRLDLLAYEAETKTYIVLELKVECGKAELDRAKLELLRYTETIRQNIHDANNVYSVSGQNVKGYIVWPKSKSPLGPQIGKTVEVPWGCLQYERVVREDYKTKNIEFELVKEPD